MRATRERILAAGKKEFAARGYGGGRIETISKLARANLRMVYHYFGDKDGLYLAVLESVYEEVRQKEAALQLDDREAQDAMQTLVKFTFDHFLQHPEFVALLTSENLRKAETIRKSKLAPTYAVPLLEMMRKLLKRGAKSGAFRKGIDAVQLFVTLHAICHLHISNKYTMSAVLQLDLADRRWLAARRRHVAEVVMRYVQA